MINTSNSTKSAAPLAARPKSSASSAPSGDGLVSSNSKDTAFAGELSQWQKARSAQINREGEWEVPSHINRDGEWQAELKIGPDGEWQ